jgi:hypothetical protein
MKARSYLILGGLLIVYIINAIIVGLATPASPWFVFIISAIGLTLFGSWLVWEKERLKRAGLL